MNRKRFRHPEAEILHLILFPDRDRLREELRSLPGIGCGPPYGELKIGDAIYSENLLCEKLGVSRTSVRKAIRLMIEENILA